MKKLYKNISPYLPYIKYIAILYGFLIVIPYFWHYQFLPTDISLSSFQLVIVLMIFMFISYFLLLGTLLFFAYLIEDFKKNTASIVLGLILSIFLIFFVYFYKIKEEDRLVILTVLISYFVLTMIVLYMGFKKKESSRIYYLSFEKKTGVELGNFLKFSLNSVKAYKNMDFLCRNILYVFHYAIFFVLSSVLFIFEVGILSKFSKNIAEIILLNVGLLVFFSLILSFIRGKKFLEALAVLLFIPVFTISFFSKSHVYLLEISLKKFNLASDNARIYVNDKIYRLLKEEHKDSSLNFCGNYIDTKDERYYLVENLKVIWNGSKEVIVLTERYGKKQKVPIPKSALLNGNIITEYRENSKQK